MSADYVDSYYARSLTDETIYPSLQDEIDTEICVIGGGLAGLATALGLVQRGKKVVLLEGRRIGWGASGRNGGFVLAGFAAGEPEIVKKVGVAQAQEMYRLSKDALGLIKKRIKDFEIPCNPVDGELVASWYDDADAIKRKVDYLATTFDEKIEFLPREKIRDHLGSKRYFDGLIYHENFHMHPLNYLRSIARNIQEKGEQIHEDSMAIDIKESESGVIVKTEKGAVTANHVVFCGSAYFNGLEKRLQRSCLPIRTYVIKTESIEKELLETAIRVPYAIRDNRWADDYYRILPDNSILWGGRVGMGAAPKDLETLMLRDMKHIYPQLEDVKAEVTWSGLMGYTVHQMPHIGKFKDNIWYCTNFGGNGLGPTTVGGEAIASAIAENDDRYKLFEPFGFAYTGGALGPLVAQTVYHGWEFADKLKEWKNRKNAA